MRSSFVRFVRMLLLPLLLLAAAVGPNAVVKAQIRDGDESKCTGEACPCVYTGGPGGYDRVCPL